MRNQVNIIRADMTEMVFEDREKGYGAYWLRKSYHKHVLVGLISTSVLALGLTFFSSRTHAGADMGPTTTETVITMIDLDPPPPIDKPEELPPPPKMPEPPQVQQLEFLPPDPTPKELVSDTATMHDIEQLKEIKNFGDTDVTEGEIDPYTMSFEEGPEGIPDVIVDHSEPGIRIFVPVDEEPQPVNMSDVQGGMTYPQLLRDAGIKGTVVVRVLVDKRGNYQKHKVINSTHPLLSQEVEEHISKLKFTPAIQGNNPIKFWVNIPFNFQLLN